ncbi:NADAR family protein [Kitasatospora sp. NA04385]|uniref:NADAR family protein n=1 Tax=Kitasatospora sp. NA04385 TaxID=2742135 RepID=UPI0015925B14|nr:NADAR family protein [Kitasatospora sp. NA04385]QKW19497.1 NADAR family protein [Kitasatospora sp. NA04385]
MTTPPPLLPHETRTHEQLTAAITSSGVRPKYLCFWGHRPQQDGQVGPGSLSQWWPSPFTVDGVRYHTAEHWMMAGKARLFGDEEAVPKILGARTPAEAKKLGRLIQGFDEDRWVAHRFELVVTGSTAKFGQDERLRTYLLRTGTRVLVEASPLDRIWGIGLAADDERAVSPEQWRGLNLLGFALMEARARLAG